MEPGFPLLNIHLFFSTPLVICGGLQYNVPVDEMYRIFSRVAIACSLTESDLVMNRFGLLTLGLSRDAEKSLNGPSCLVLVYWVARLSRAERRDFKYRQTGSVGKERGRSPAIGRGWH